MLIIIVAASLVGGAIGLFFFKKILMGLTGFAMILAATADYWLGTTYRVNAKGIESRTGLSHFSMEWGEIKTVVIEPTSIKVSPLTNQDREAHRNLEVFRGILLRTVPEIRESVIAFIRLRVNPNVELVETLQESPR